jgi:hypothetical protein
MVLALTAVASAALRLVLADAVHLPPWPLSPDGEVVAAGPDLAARGGRVEPLGGGLYRVAPDPGAEEVHLRAGSAAVVAPVEPPAGRIVVRARPERPVKGRDAEVALDLTVLGPRGEADPGAAPPVVTSSAGAIHDLQPAGPGRFTARLEMPAARHPELAAILALSPRCPLCPTPRAVGAAVLPLTGATVVPGHTDPNVKVTVEIAGRTFGPVVADGTGHFDVPVEVPPGERYGRGVSEDRLGNRRVEVLDLRLPPIVRLACAAWPAALPADGRAEAGVWCVASDARGRPAPGARLDLFARTGRVTRLEPLGEGLFRARYTAPRGGGGGRDLLSAAYAEGGLASRVETAIVLATGAPAELGYALEREPVPVGQAIGARTWARDGRGDPLPPPSGPPGSREGFVSTDRFAARSEAGDWVQRAPLRLELPAASAAAALFLRHEGAVWIASARGLAGGPVPGLEIRFGSGSRAVTDARGDAREPVVGPSETAMASGGARAAAWQGFPVAVPPVALERVFDVLLGPEASVDVRASAEGGYLRWKVRDPGGRVLPGRRVRLEASGLRLGPPEPEGDGGRCRAEGQGTATVVDAETGVAAVVEVR